MTHAGVLTPRQYAFQHAGLDRAEHVREDEQALRRLWPEARVMLFDEGLVHFHGDVAAPEFPLGAELSWCDNGSFLGLDGEQAWFAAPIRDGVSLPGNVCDLRTAAVSWTALESAICAQGRALVHWQTRNRYCGSCGARLELIRGGFAAKCPTCFAEHYPRTDPAIIVAVSDGERLLLGRQASWPEHRYSVLAGFLEPGESLEQAVAREVMEEAGVRIDACEYLASQPWPFPSSLMLGFRASAAAQEPRFGGELEDARWFSAAQIREQVAAGSLKVSPRLSISRWLIDDWLASH